MGSIRDTTRYEEVLARAAFFSTFEEGELTRLIDACERRILAPREPLWAVGSAGDSAYILIEGRLEQVHRFQPDGTRIDQVDQPGDIVGLSYLVKGWNHQSAASAVERTELLRLERDRFQALFDAEDMAAYRLVDHLADEVVREMRDANRRLHEVFGNPAETLRNLRRRVRQA
jgi:CRP/FNR family transcriptional regulator, cyclic AMP receptor protein